MPVTRFIINIVLKKKEIKIITKTKKMLGGDRYKLQSKLVTNKNVFRGVGYADEPVVIKLDNSELKELLRHEAQIYTKLRRFPGVLTMKWYGVQ